MFMVPAFLASLACLSAGQDSPHGATNLWPMRAGNTWTVEVTSAGSSVLRNIAITTAVPGKEYSTAALEYRANDVLVQKETYRFNDAGVYRVQGGPDGAGKIEPPLPVLLYPMTAGKKWTWTGTFVGKKDKTPAAAVMTTTGPETIKVPAGTFQAFKVHVDLAVRAAGIRYTYQSDNWYATGVGLIRQKTTQGSTITDSNLTKYSLQ